MSWTYTTLIQAIQDQLENDEATFVADLPEIVKLAEDRILKKVQLSNFKKTSAPTISDGTPEVVIPSDFLAPYHFAVISSATYTFLIFKEVSFIREAYPVIATTGIPKHYAKLSDTEFLLGPTPTSGITAELRYFYRPTSIVDGATSWLGTHAESTLLDACLYEGYKYMKGSKELLDEFKERMNDSISDLKLLAEGRNTTDEYRAG